MKAVKIYISVLLLGTIVTGMSLPANADLSDAWEAYQAGDGKLAGRILWNTASNLADYANNYLSGALERAMHGEYNPGETTTEWIVSAADQGFVQAKVILGILYENGNPVLEQDLERAHQEFLEAAQDGSPEGQLCLANWLKGHGTPDQQQEAAVWARLAELGGVEEAQDVFEGLIAGMKANQLATIEESVQRFRQNFLTR